MAQGEQRQLRKIARDRFGMTLRLDDVLIDPTNPGAGAQLEKLWHKQSVGGSTYKDTMRLGAITRPDIIRGALQAAADAYNPSFIEAVLNCPGVNVPAALARDAGDMFAPALLQDVYDRYIKPFDQVRQALWADSNCRAFFTAHDVGFGMKQVKRTEDAPFGLGVETIG